ncbi:hypothetical protein RUM44_013114 [Polyplax serrata]|uniref:Sm domain-containing protein n=1 Tax=Polyplax serrata TaxID=468196 RepID=A0ABR1BD80_POLSC
MENRYTTVDLRNEMCVTGKVTGVDGYMNIVISDATLYDTDGECQYFPNLHIQARNIRNVHIPDNISIKKAINSVLFKKMEKTDKKLSFKQSRAKKQHKETLKLIEEAKKEKAIEKAKTVEKY